jgi:hypothetical protein
MAVRGAGRSPAGPRPPGARSPAARRDCVDTPPGVGGLERRHALRLTLTPQSVQEE